MVTLLLIFLVLVDVIMLGIIFYYSKKRNSPMDALKEITQEKRELKELGQSIREDINFKKNEFQDLYKKINALAAEAEIESKSYRANLSTEMGQLLEEFSGKLNHTAQKIMKEKMALSALMQKSERERKTLQRIVLRSEKLGKFFDKKVPYEEVLEEIEDKKYVDARHLLAQGLSKEEVSSEVGLSLSEVALIASIG